MKATSSLKIIRRMRGFSLLEMLLVLAILGILASLSFANLRPPSARLLANDYQAMVQQARFEAIKRNLPVMVVWDGERFISRLRNDSDVSCSDDNTRQLRVKRVDEYPDVRVAGVIGSGGGIVWLPSGLARTCQNGLDVAGEVSFSRESGGNVVTVRISPSGRVGVG